jgi:hypothetical protein
MFHLHDTTRRRLCLVGFLTLGALPTLLAGAWCITRHMPGCVQAEAQRLGRQVGLDVKLAGFSHVSPGRALYENVEAADLETGQTIFRCRQLEIEDGPSTDVEGQRRATIRVLARQLEIEAASLGRIWQCLQHTLEGFRGPLNADLLFAASELTLQAGKNSQTLTNVEGALESVPAMTRMRVDFRLVGADTPEPAYIRITRDRQTSPPATTFELYTGDGPLPCSVLAMGLAELKPLGPRCRFVGRIWADQTANGWEGRATGRLVELDLGSLVSDHFPHKLTGIAEAAVDARFLAGCLEEGRATVKAGHGVIDRSLIVAAVERLGLTPGTNPLPTDKLVPYEQLAFSANLDAEGLKMSGLCATPGTVLSDSRGCLLGQPEQQPIPAVALVRTLVPQSIVQVPATRQTNWLLDHLPLPPVIPPLEPDSSTRNARLRVLNNKTLQ